MEPKKANDPDELGGWRINGRLGEGGFGTVFLAEKGAQKAAIKIIRQEFVQEEDARRRLATEADVLSKLSDPSIGKIIDSDLSGEFPWIATEFINGPTLEDKVKYEGPLEEIAWFNLASNLFHAIVTANELGIIHKDIKPSNIILGETGNKLIDFGIAHVSGQTRTAIFGDREGSTPFSSPEHFAIKPNPKMDVFSAAATLAYAAKGKRIWRGDNDLQLMRSINEDEPNLDGLSENQAKFLFPLFEKNPSDRPAAAEALQSALAYIEFLLGKTDQPRALRSQRNLRKIFFSKKSFASTFTLLAIFVGLTFFEGNNSDTPSFSPAAPTTSPVSPAAPTTSPISPAAPKPTGLNSNDCQELFLSNSKDAITACKAASAANDARSNYYLAALYDQGGQKKEAETYYLRAVSLYKDDTKSMLGLVQIYLDRKDNKNYELWVSKCATYQIKTTSGARCKLLFGIDQIDAGQTKVGIAYLTDAFDWGNVSAGTFLAKYYETEKDDSRSLIWYEKAAEEGDPLARSGLIALAYDLKKFDIWKKWITKSANEGNVTDIGKLALYLTVGDMNYSEGKKWGIKGGNAGDAMSMFAAGYSYYKGDKNIPEAKNWLLKSAKLNNTLAARVLGEIFRSEKNPTDAIFWYKKASSGNDLTSTYQLALIYLNDMNNPSEACTYFRSTLDLAEKLKKNGDFSPSNDQKLVDNSTLGIANFCS